jgi:hypothetical protein
MLRCKVVRVVKYIKAAPHTVNLPQTSYSSQHDMRFIDITAFVVFIVVAVALPVDKPVADYTCSQAEDCCPHPGPSCS